MKILCAKSGILFKVEYFPFTSDNASMVHPVFEIPQHKLLSLVPKWTKGELNQVDTYLYFLSLLDSTGQVEFRTHCKPTEETIQILSNNLENLIQIVGAMNCIKHPEFVVTRICITKENNSLDNVHYWLQTWQQNIDDFKQGYANQELRQSIVKRELALEKLIKTPYKDTQLAAQIASWAELAGAFPQFETITPFGLISIAEYWKLIIRKCMKAESIFSIPTKDIVELIEHCEDNIEHGTIYAHTLMSILREGRDKQNSFLGLGSLDFDSSSQSFVLLDSNDSVEKANFDLLVQTAPIIEPKLTDYPTRFEWLKAHTKWKLVSASQNVNTNSGVNQNV